MQFNLDQFGVCVVCYSSSSIQRQLKTMKCLHSICNLCIEKENVTDLNSCPQCFSIDLNQFLQIKKNKQSLPKKLEPTSTNECYKHPNNSLEILCIDELTLICSECTCDHQYHSLIKDYEIVKKYVNNQAKDCRKKVQWASDKAQALLENYNDQLGLINQKQIEFQDELSKITNYFIDKIKRNQEEKLSLLNSQFAQIREDFEQKVFILEQIVKRCDKNLNESLAKDFQLHNQLKAVEDLQNQLKVIEHMKLCYQNKELNQFQRLHFSFQLNINEKELTQSIYELGELSIKKEFIQQADAGKDLDSKDLTTLTEQSKNNLHIETLQSQLQINDSPSISLGNQVGQQQSDVNEQNQWDQFMNLFKSFDVQDQSNQKVSESQPKVENLTNEKNAGSLGSSSQGIGFPYLINPNSPKNITEQPRILYAIRWNTKEVIIFDCETEKLMFKVAEGDLQYSFPEGSAHSTIFQNNLLIICGGLRISKSCNLS